MKNKKMYFYAIGGVISVVLLSISLDKQQQLPNQNTYHPAANTAIDEKVSLRDLGVPIYADQCNSQNNEGVVYTTQSYRSEAFKDDRNWLTSHFNKAFSQGEGACGSNSLDTALYGQKAMISRFVEELAKIEKKTGQQSQYDYVRKTALELQEAAGKRSMRQGEWLNEFGYGTLDIQKRPLTIIDGLEAFFPNIINEVKAWSKDGYTPAQIYDDVANDVYTNGYEFVDSTINLSIPLNNPDRAKPRWKQELFREFVMRTFDQYDATIYLSTINNNQDERLNNASQNPRLSNGKTIYTMYREWLLEFKKFTPYKSHLEQLHNTGGKSSVGSNTPPNGQKAISPNPSTLIGIGQKDASASTLLLPQLTNPRADNSAGSALITPQKPGGSASDQTTPSAGAISKPTSSATTRILQYGVQVMPSTKTEKTTETTAPELPASLPPFGSRTLRF